MKDFNQGVFFAVAILVDIHNQPTMAKNILIEAGLEDADCSSLDDLEKNALRKLKSSENLPLRGL